jgi:hypothetical protein
MSLCSNSQRYFPAEQNGAKSERWGVTYRGRKPSGNNRQFLFHEGTTANTARYLHRSGVRLMELRWLLNQANLAHQTRCPFSVMTFIDE